MGHLLWIDHSACCMENYRRLRQGTRMTLRDRSVRWQPFWSTWKALKRGNKESENRLWNQSWYPDNWIWEHLCLQVKMVASPCCGKARSTLSETYTEIATFRKNNRFLYLRDIEHEAFLMSESFQNICTLTGLLLHCCKGREGGGILQRATPTSIELET